MSANRQILSLLIWIAICFMPGLFGSRFMPGEWYMSLSKPRWTPPGYIFGPVWTILYISMGVSAWMIWKRVGLSGGRTALSIFVIQLIFNGLWSYLFFGLKKPGMAFLDICLLFCMILVTVVLFWQLYKPAGILLLPYQLWVGFATVLNLAIWRMNS